MGDAEKLKLMLEEQSLEHAKKIAQLEAELLKFRRLDMAWAEEVKALDLTIATLNEENGGLIERLASASVDVMLSQDRLARIRQLKVEIANLKEELGHLHTRFDRELNNG